MIQVEVQNLLKDVMRLDDRVGKLQSHFNQASDDVRQIRISTDKITKRGDRIVEVELEDPEAEIETEAAAPQLKVIPDD